MSNNKQSTEPMVILQTSSTNTAQGIYVQHIKKEVTMSNNKHSMKYIKKPVEIEALQFTRNNWDEIRSFTNNTAHTLRIEKRIDGIATCIIPTLEGKHIATEGDFIIKGIKGEFYPCKQDIFEMTYEPVVQGGNK